MINLNHGSGTLDGVQSVDVSVSEDVNQWITVALHRRRDQSFIDTPRNYIGMSELGEKCLRHLYLKHIGIKEDTPYTGERLRAMEMGHYFEAMVLDWMNDAGFKIVSRDKHTGKPFEFVTAGGRIRGHIDGAIISGPPIRLLTYPALWENKALKARYWNAIVKHGLEKAEPAYYGQIQQYMGYGELGNTLFTTINKDTAEIFHAVYSYNGKVAQKVSDRGVSLIKCLDNGLIPARISANSDFHICKMCDRRQYCWSLAA